MKVTWTIAYRILSAGIIIIFLGILLWCSNAPCFKILIGSAKSSYENEISAVDFTSSKPINGKEKANKIILSLILGETVPESSAPNTVPDAILMIQAGRKEVAYFFPIWINEDSIIFLVKNGEEKEYREIDTLSDAELKALFDMR